MVELVKGNVSVPAWGVGAAPGDMALDPKSFLHPAPNQSTGKGGLNTTQGLCPNSARTKVTNFSLLHLYFHRNACANVHLMGQPNTFLAQGDDLRPRAPHPERRRRVRLGADNSTGTLSELSKTKTH
jgi:hypothetical protein